MLSVNPNLPYAPHSVLPIHHMLSSPVHQVLQLRRTSTLSTGLEHSPLTCYETVVQDTIAMIASSVEGRGEDLGEEVLEQIFSKSGSSLEPSFNLGRFPCHLCSTRIYPVDAGPLKRPVCNRPLARDGPSPSSTDAGRWSRPAIFWLAEEVCPLQQIGTTAHAHK